MRRAIWIWWSPLSGCVQDALMFVSTKGRTSNPHQNRKTEDHGTPAVDPRLSVSRSQRAGRYISSRLAKEQVSSHSDEPHLLPTQNLCHCRHLSLGTLRHSRRQHTGAACKQSHQRRWSHSRQCHRLQHHHERRLSQRTGIKYLQHSAIPRGLTLLILIVTVIIISNIIVIMIIMIIISVVLLLIIIVLIIIVITIITIMTSVIIILFILILILILILTIMIIITIIITIIIIIIVIFFFTFILIIIFIFVVLLPSSSS